MKQILLLLGCMCVLSMSALAQDKTVTGKVTSDDGTPLAGVSIVVKGTSKGTNTDAAGTFKIAVDPKNTVTFSFVGFESQSLLVGNRTTFSISLVSDASQLSEVVVTGYGGVMNKREVTGAISKVRGKDIENMPIQSFDRALQGQAAGVQVTSANGVPGGPVRVRIRGVGSISAGNDPLYVVDGVQLNSTNASSFTSSNPLNFLNPNDIESIEILKDAAAASIYGSQAANGVVLVTTKKGKAGKTKFDFNYSQGAVEPIKYLNVLNSQEWIQVRSEALFNRNGGEFKTQRSNALSAIRLSPTLTDGEIAALPTYDWQKVGFRTGKLSTYGLSISGGSDKTTFFWSGTYDRQDANLINVDFERGTTALRVNHKISDRFSFEENINLASVKSRGQFGSPNGGSFLGASAFSTPLMIPTVPFYNEDGSYFGAPPVGTPGILNQNVLMVSELNEIKSVTNQMVANMSFTYKITPNLVFRPFVGIDYRILKGDNYTDPRTPDAFNVRGRSAMQYNQNTNFLANATLNYSKLFAEKHTFGGLLGIEYRSDVQDGAGATGEGFPTPAFKYLNSAANPISIGSFWSGFRKGAMFGQLKYEYDQKYFVQGIVRYDGSSRFGRNTRWGVFPAASAGWLMSEESFLQNNKIINELKIRASYGSTGNDQIGNFPSLGLFGGGAAYNGVSGITVSSLANPDLQWERNVELSAGIDYSILDRRVFGSFDYFDRRSKDLLLSQAVPQTSGFSSITSNVGEVQNEGLEFEITTINLRSENFKWETRFNVTKIFNKVVKLYDGITKLQNKDSLIALPGNTSVIVGYPLGTILSARYAGVNPATGRPMWYDENDNLVYTIRSPADLKYMGTSISTFFGGLTNTVKYKGIEVSAFLQYDFGRKSTNSQGSFMSENGGRLFNSLKDVYERRWLKPGDITDVPRPFDGNAEIRGSSHLSGTRMLEDASYVRLKSVSASYIIPKKITGKLKFLREARIYGQALNLLTWTKWTGYDPEWLDLGSGNNGVIPQSRSYSVGLQLGF
jgi:TonB-dependent starch-binding outer membrane protein SusC